MLRIKSELLQLLLDDGARDDVRVLGILWYILISKIIKQIML
jgi:hypothetical protein